MSDSWDNDILDRALRVVPPTQFPIQPCGREQVYRRCRAATTLDTVTLNDSASYLFSLSDHESKDSSIPDDFGSVISNEYSSPTSYAETTHDVEKLLSYHSPSTPSFSNISTDHDLGHEINPQPPSVQNPVNQSTNIPARAAVLPVSSDDDTASSAIAGDSEMYKTLHGYKLVGDNVDKCVKARYTRCSRPTSKSLYYYHYYALRDRTDISGLSDVPRYNLKFVSPLSIPVTDVLPTFADKSNLYHNFNIIISRLVVQNLKYFECYSDVVTQHIRHDFYDQMSSKSDIVPLGLILKNEADRDEMISILETVQSRIPTTSTENHGTFQNRTLLGGDQLSTAMTRRVIFERKNSTDSTKALQGIIPVCEDWHTKLCFLTCFMKLLFKDSSFRERGTLYNLKVLLNRKSVTFHVVQSYIITAVMEVLNMTKLDDIPSNSSLISELDWTDSLDTRKDSLYAVSAQVINQFVCLDTLSNDIDVGSEGDQVQDYSRLLLSTGMLYLEYCDAIQEGDGLRVLRCWRYFLVLFKSTGRTNYSIESFNMLAQYHFLLSNRQAHQLVWSRFVNVHGLPGHNIPCDLYMEHLNRVFKNAVAGLGSNKKDSDFIRAGKIVGILENVAKQFDQVNGVNSGSGKHKMASVKEDMATIIRVLKEEKVLKYVSSERQHISFPSISPNPFSTIDDEGLITWMYQQMNNLIHGF